jgi:hypothetical protein
VQRLREELKGQQALLIASQEETALMKAEVARLAKDNGQLKEEILEHNGIVKDLQMYMKDSNDQSLV